MIRRLNVYRGVDRLTFERGSSSPVVFTALTARRVELGDDTIRLVDRRGRAIGPFTPSGLVLAARRRYYRLRAWYDQIDARRVPMEAIP